MEEVATIITTLKYLDYKSVVRYCNQSRKIKRICIEYAPSIFGKSYNDILYIIAINKQFPTLHHHISLDKLYDFYKSYPKIWQELMTYPTVSNELPMCQTIIPGEWTIYQDDDGNSVDPKLPKNVKYIAPFHKPLLNPHRKITFLFFRSLDKLPTNTFTIENDEIVTLYGFIQGGNTPNLTNIINTASSDMLNNPDYKKTWTNYINDPFWKTKSNKKYYPFRSLNEEIKISEQNTPCDAYPLTGFELTDKALLFKKYFKLDHPAIEINFDT